MAPFIFWNLAFYTIIRTQLGQKVTGTKIFTILKMMERIEL
ncbi:LexA repressor-like protein [Paenibacillus larvae subsp. larvae DSM 25430]|nr:LexA repressor-like protein [Paenibacillus larvae subsp. larvae DSM 25430]